MSSATDLEDRLTELFESQARALHVPAREWSDVSQTEAAGPSRTRPPWPRIGLSIAAAIPLVLALVLATGDRGTQQVTTGGGGAPAAQLPRLQVETRQVTLAADAISIDVGGKRFVTTQPLEAHSDPGMPNEYTTLELTWREHGVEMRMNIYFTSDGREWWSKEIRTYDGNAQGEWITYEGDYFRSPLGTAFTGDVDVEASSDRATGRLRMVNVRLEAFRRPASCTNPTGPYALEAATDRITLRVGDGSSGYGAGVRLLDTTTCATVSDPSRFTYDWRAQDPRIVTVDATGATADLRAKAAGSTTVQVTAREVGTGQVAGTTALEVVVRATDGARAGAGAPRQPGSATPERGSSGP